MAIYRQNVASGPTPALHRQFVWSGDQLIAMYGLDEANPYLNPPELLARFVYVPGSRVPAYAVYPANTVLNPDLGSGSEEHTYRLVADHLGSVRLVVDAATGEVRQRLDYDAFGGVMRDSRPEFQPFGFAGGIYLRGPRLVRFGARDYDPHIGRWVSRDPILFNGGSDNLYVYCNNDPVNCTDPTGLVVPFVIWGGALAAGWIGDYYYQTQVKGVAAADIDLLEFGLVGAGSAGVAAGGWALLAASPEIAVATAAGGGAAGSQITQRAQAVIGQFPQYIRTARALKLPHFEVQPILWERWTTAQQWAANQRFLDIGIARGQEFLVAAQGRIQSTSALAKEIEYLLSRGYVWAEGATKLVPGP